MSALYGKGECVIGSTACSRDFPERPERRPKIEHDNDANIVAETRCKMMIAFIVVSRKSVFEVRACTSVIALVPEVRAEHAVGDADDRRSRESPSVAQ